MGRATLPREEPEGHRPGFHERMPSRGPDVARSNALAGASALTWALVVVLAWAPLPLGSNRPWSWSLLAVLVGALLLLVAISPARRLVMVRVPAAIWLAAALITSVFVWIFAQAVLGTSAPLAHPIWGELTSRGFPSSPGVSLDPELTWEALLRVGTTVGVFVLALELAQDPRSARRLSLAFVFIAAVYALYGLLRLAFGWDILLWEVNRYTGYATSTFVNRNHFATYVNLAVVVAVSTLVSPLFRTDRISWRQTGLGLVKHAFEKNGLLLAALIALVFASLLSGSRGGFISVSLALIFLTAAALLKGRPAGLRVVAVITLVAIISLVFIEFAGHKILQRFAVLSNQTDVDGAGRFAVWDVALRALYERPFLGHGYGGFESIFTLHRDERFSVVYDFAHNTLLEDAVGLGVLAAAFWYIAILTLFIHCIRGFAIRRRHQVYPLAAASATVLVGVHALVDFSIQIPAIALSYAALLGIGCAQAQPSTPAAPEALDRQDPIPRAARESS